MATTNTTRFTKEEVMEVRGRISAAFQAEKVNLKNAETERVSTLPLDDLATLVVDMDLQGDFRNRKYGSNRFLHSVARQANFNGTVTEPQAKICRELITKYHVGLLAYRNVQRRLWAEAREARK